MEKKRNSIRLRNYDYTSTGLYFVTICTHERENLFGEVLEEQMVLNDWGQIVQQEWENTASLRAYVQLDEYVIMPNHFHAILALNVGAQHAAPSVTRPRMNVDAGSLGAVLRAFKSAVTREINLKRNTPAFPVWQRNYFERVIRNDQELTLTREYIASNPLQWHPDEEYVS